MWVNNVMKMHHLQTGTKDHNNASRIDFLSASTYMAIRILEPGDLRVPA
jgi:hypothetical protein